MTIQDACSDFSFFLQPASDQNPMPNSEEKSQLLLSTCNVKWADLIVYTAVDIFSERIYFDNVLWYKTMLPKLTSFYFSYIYPDY